MGTTTSQPVTRVLFVGNSLTAANDLPAMVKRVAAAAGERFECEAVVFADHSLEDHWTRGDARRAIAGSPWNYVVLQQGSSARPESRVLLIEYAKKFDREIRRSGARTALYMVWPTRERRGDFDAVSTSYAKAAESVTGVLLPVGDAWRALWRRDASVRLYADDGLHPSRIGSNLAALVIYQGLSGHTPPPMSPLVPMPDSTAALLRTAAAEVIVRR